MKTAGYSGTPLEKKLGLKEGFVIKLINIPEYYFNLFQELPAGLVQQEDGTIEKDFIHFFTKSTKVLESGLLKYIKEIKQNGMIWVSWPKKASKVPTDVTEDVIRNLALSMGLVDVKVCAVDKTWSGLKLVIPVKNRKK